MSRVSILLGVLVVVGVSAVSPFAQSNSLKGAWKVVAVTGADGKTNDAPPPSLYLFTDRHYSIQRVTGTRPTLPEKPADKDLAATFGPYTANSGTYEVKGATLTTRPIVAKNPSVMTGPTISSELKFEGSGTVHLTGTAPGGGKTVTKLQRVE